MSQKHVSFLLFMSLFVQTLIATSSKQEEGSQWMKGVVSAKIEGVPPEKAWPFIEDFCNAYKILPALTLSFCSKGDPQHVEVGHRRYMVFENSLGQFIWENHRVEGIDRINYVLTYRILENINNITYDRSIMTVLPDKYGSELRWEYVVQSNVFTPESFRNLLSLSAQSAATNIKNLTQSS